jgi:hypothetical protein
LPDISTTAPFASFNAGQAAVPLRVGHLEQVDLRHRAGDIQQGIDPAKRLQRPVDNGCRCRRFREVDIDGQRFGASRLHRVGRFLEVGTVAGGEDDRGEVARETDGGGTPDALARAGDDRY